METLMTWYRRLESWYGRRVIIGVVLATLLLVTLGFYLGTRASVAVDTPETKAKEVRVARAGSLLNNAAVLRTVGTVRAVSEARLETESAGRVTAVNVKINDFVQAGTILASIENASERASLLQAQGAYESMLASNAQSTIGLTEATAGAENTYRTAFTTADDVVRNLTDELFSNANESNTGLKIDGNGAAPRLNAERALIGSILSAWNTKVQDIHANDRADLLSEAGRDLTRISTFVSDLAFLVADEKPNAAFSEDTLASYKARLGAARTRLDGTLQSITSAQNALKSARQSVEGGAVGSESEARLKQSLGALRAAQASYEKTIVRSPISGTVNAIYLTANTFVGNGAPAAVVANNNALEITTSVGENERAFVAIGSTVRINDTWDGTITRIAPAIDPQTGKIEIKVSVNAKSDEAKLANGTTVSLALAAESSADTANDLRIPIKALKITPQGTVVFSVSDTQTLIAIPILIDTIIGDSVRIKSGITSESVIVDDARGLKENDTVTIVTGS